MRLMRLIYFIKVELLFNSRIRIEQINLLELKFNLLIILVFNSFYFNTIKI